MRICLSALLVLILLSNSQSLPTITSSCGNGLSCVSNTLCELCRQGKGPECPISICIDGCCGVIPLCSLTLGAACSGDGGCPTPDVCVSCTSGHGPTCYQGLCLNGNCTLITPCSIQTHCPSTVN
jgi:hypothetical protein